MNPLVSIVVPIYNIEDYLTICLDSIIKQTYKNIEILLIDDGSTDSSGNISDDYQKNDKRIIVKHNTNHGVSYSRNYGINLSKGSYLLFIDPDDYIDLDYVETLLKSFITENYDLVVCNIYNIFPNSIEINSINENLLSQNYYDDFYLLNGLRVSVFNKLFKSEIIKTFNIRFLENLSYAEDSLFNYEYAKYVRKYKYINRAMYYYCHIRNNSLSKKKGTDTFNNAIFLLKTEKSYLKQNNIKNRELILTKSAITQIGQFAILKDEKNLEYFSFYKRVQVIRNIVDNWWYHNKLKGKLVVICMKYNIVFPVFMYYCILKIFIEKIKNRS